MANCIPLVFLSVLCLSITAKTHVQSSLYRDYKTKHGKFKSNQNQSLLVTLTKSHFLEDALECSFHCIGDSKCLSYNIAKSPDSNGIYICEVLATDKYRAKDRLQANSSFHHFSPMVSSFFLRRRSDQFSFESNHSFLMFSVTVVCVECYTFDENYQSNPQYNTRYGKARYV